MGKETWLHSYEVAIEDIADELDTDMDIAESVLTDRLNVDPNYLDGYLAH